MDFDDLEDETSRRLEAGEEVVGHVVENHQPRPGDVLPPISRSFKLPDQCWLPQAARRQLPPLNGEQVAERRPVLRLLCVHGVADSYQQDWSTLESEAPPEIEVAMHEFPGHGHREKEPILGSIDELADDAYEAFRHSMDTGSFALLGHSIGCLVITRVAKRAREELGVEPVMVFMVERGACQHPLFTEKGYEKLHSDPVGFMSIYQPTVVAFVKSAGDIGQRTLDMWQRGWFCENHTLEQGYHTFRCPLIAMFAEYMVRCERPAEELDPYNAAIIQDGSKLFNKIREDGVAFTGHFPYETYEHWHEWTEFKDTFRIVEVKKCDHMSIKSSIKFKITLWDTLKEVIKKW